MSAKQHDVAELAEKVESLETEVEQLREEKQNLESELNDTRKYAEALQRQLDTMKTGLTELQVSELQSGAMLSEDGVQDYTLREDLDLDIQHCGGDDQFIRLDTEADEKSAERALPDANEMCRVEQYRQMVRRGLLSADEIPDVDDHRALLVWDSIDKLANEAGTGGKRWRVGSEKVRRVIRDNDSVEASSVYELARRVMKRLPELTDGVLKCKKDDGRLYLVGEKEEIQESLKPLYESTRTSDGSNIVVRR